MSDALPPSQQLSDALQSPQQLSMSMATMTPGPIGSVVTTHSEAHPASTTTAVPAGTASHADGAPTLPPTDAPLTAVASQGTAPHESDTPPPSPPGGGTLDPTANDPMAPATIIRTKEKRGRHAKGTAKAHPGKPS
jgi:hypothetical protein